MRGGGAVAEAGEGETGGRGRFGQRGILWKGRSS